ncbi:GlxA family transcriptional regulator [Desertibaculum subflavum]|uniref:GlxA family transcriptional regulator n=1 Tax=Desertibaculum subflavum TaxID=2268458 RepID=UPI000E660CA8
MPHYTIAVLDGALGAATALTLDALAAARRIAEALGKPALEWRVLSPAPAVRLGPGLTLSADPLGPRTRLGRTTLIIPGLGFVEPAEIALRLAASDVELLARLARRHHAQGGAVAASCSGVFLLGAGGLLAGRSATTAWWLADAFRRLFPDSRLETGRMVVQDGRIATAGAALAQMDLMLHLLRRDCGPKVADLAARYLLIDGRPSQARYMVWSHLRHADELVARLEGMANRKIGDSFGVAEAARALRVTERTLHRRVLKATGRSPSAFLQSIRLARAHHLLETTGLPVEEVARRIGYGDATALRRLIRRNFQAAPRDLRRPVGQAAGPVGPIR